MFRAGTTDGPSWQTVGGLDFAFQVQGHWIKVPRGMLDRPRGLEQVFDCVWATSWSTDGPGLIGSKLGVGEAWPVIAIYGAGRAGRLRR